MEILKVVLTSVLSAAALFLIAKVMGHKQVAQLDVFGYITGITKWLSRKLKHQGVKKPSDILIALCDDNHNLSIYPLK